MVLWHFPSCMCRVGWDKAQALQALVWWVLAVV